jgi:hypothetical protein
MIKLSPTRIHLFWAVPDISPRNGSDQSWKGLATYHCGMFMGVARLRLFVVAITKFIAHAFNWLASAGWAQSDTGGDNEASPVCSKLC